jgi:hypothetical protein
MNSRPGTGGGFTLLRDTALAWMILLLVSGCGDPPVAIPPPQTGSINIIAMDTATIDSIDVGLDDMPMGRWKNPATLYDIIAGTHLLAVRDRLGFGEDTIVRVADAEQSSVLMRIQTEGPYVGSFAPAFRTKSVTGDTIDLVMLRGKVVLLAFFEHT